MQEGVLFCDAPFDNLRAALAIALGRETVGSDTMSDEVVDNTLGTSL